MLTEKLKAACREYLIDFNWCAAMQRAGYSFKTAKNTGWEYFKDPEVAFFLKKLMDKQEAGQELSAAVVLEEMRRLATSNIADYYKWNEKKKKYVLRPLDELTRAQTAAIAEYVPGQMYKLYNKDPSLNALGKFFKLYSDVDQIVTNFVMMTELKLNGKPVEFKIGKPAPKRPEQKKN